MLGQAGITGACSSGHEAEAAGMQAVVGGCHLQSVASTSDPLPVSLFAARRCLVVAVGVVATMHPVGRTGWYHSAATVLLCGV